LTGRVAEVGERPPEQPSVVEVPVPPLGDRQDVRAVPPHDLDLLPPLLVVPRPQRPGRLVQVPEHEGDHRAPVFRPFAVRISWAWASRWPRQLGTTIEHSGLCQYDPI